MKIQYWSDYACPYCYIGETRLKNAIADLGIADDVELEIHAFELDSTAPKEVTGDTLHRFARKYGLSLDEAAERIEGISELGRDLGIDFRYATTLYSNTFDAHRLTKWAHTLGNTAIEQLLFDAYFTKNEVLADHDVLVKIAEEAGLDPEEARKVLESDAFAEEVRTDEMASRALGVTGVPFFLIDGKTAIPGAMSEDAFKHTIKKALDSQTVSAKGATCTSDSCAL